MSSQVHRTVSGIAGVILAAVAFGPSVGTQGTTQGAKDQPVNDSPNPYRTVENYFQRPGRVWGSTSAVEVDKDGKSIWVAERCGSNSCTNTPGDDPVLLYDEKGKLVRSFGAGLIMFPHGIHVDRDGNVWVTDGQDNAAALAAAAGRGAARGAAPADGAGRGAAPAAPAAPAGGDPAAGRGRGRGRGATDGAAGTTTPAPPPAAGAPAAAAGGAQAGAARGAAPAGGPAGIGSGVPNATATKGHQVFKFSPDGKVLLTLGKPGGGAPGAGAPEFFFQPNDVITNDAGEIFVAERHGNGGRILKFTKEGQFIKAWGTAGNGPGQFNIPHSLAMDSKGRLFVADRGNTRIQIFDQEGTFQAEWYQFSRISGLYIDKRSDTIYAADSESSPTSHPGGWRRGIRIGSARDGKVTAFIPDPEHTDPKASAPGGTSAAEGVVVDAAGNVYGAEVGPRAVKKYVKK